MMKMGIIGFGGMANHHYETLKNYSRIQFVGVYDIEEEPMRHARELGLKTYESREALLADSELEAVLVATSNEVHREICIDALRAGKHVICEKPVTINCAELEEIIAVAKETGKIFTVDQNRRTNHDFVLMRRNVEAGLLGDVYQIESCVEGSRGMPEGWRCREELGGGMLLDWGVHLIDQLMYMYADKKVTRVSCKMFSVHYDIIDDNFNLTLEFENGPTCYIRVGTNDFIAHPRWHVCGTSGTLQIDSWDCNGRIIHSLADEREWANEIVMTKAGPTKTMAPRNEKSTETITLSEPEEVRDDLTVVYDGFADAIEGKGPLWVQPEETVRVMQVIDAAFESAKNGTSVTTNI